MGEKGVGGGWRDRASRALRRERDDIVRHKTGNDAAAATQASKRVSKEAAAPQSKQGSKQARRPACRATGEAAPPRGQQTQRNPPTPRIHSAPHHKTTKRRRGHTETAAHLTGAQREEEKQGKRHNDKKHDGQKKCIVWPRNVRRLRKRATATHRRRRD